MKLESFPNGIFGATTYLLYDEKSKDALIIDATSSIDEIEKIIKKNNLNLKYILLTHGHFDHVYCLSEMKDKFKNTPILINKEDVVLLDNIETQCNMADVENVKVPCVDGLIDENTKNLKIGEFEIKAIHTKGHTKGGMCYLINDILFSGDTLFNSSIGRCDLYGGSMSEIEYSIKEKLFKLDDNITVYPGHGNKTTIGFEKMNNPYFGKNYQ